MKTVEDEFVKISAEEANLLGLHISSGMEGEWRVRQNHLDQMRTDREGLGNYLREKHPELLNETVGWCIKRHSDGRFMVHLELIGTTELLEHINKVKENSNG